MQKPKKNLCITFLSYFYRLICELWEINLFQSSYVVKILPLTEKITQSIIEHIGDNVMSYISE